MAYLYRHIRLDRNQPFYIGIGSDDSYKRAYDKRSRSKYWKSVINKTDYEVEILMEDLTWEEACEKEKEFISLYGRADLGTGILCNLTEGGEGVLGMKHSEETRKKIAEDNKRPEKLRVCMENLKKMQTPEAIEKARKNRDYKEISRKRVANTDYNKVKEASERSVTQYSLEGLYIKEWTSISEACKALPNLFDSNIIRCCKGDRSHAGGFRWRYTDSIPPKPIKKRKKTNSNTINNI